MEIPIIDIEFNEDIQFEVFGYGLVYNPAIVAESIYLNKQEPSDEVLEYILSKGEVVDMNEYMFVTDQNVSDDEINLSADEDSEQDNKYFKILYEYAPDKVSENSRKFCKALAGSGKLFRKEDLVNSNMNPGFGPDGAESYNIFLYKGGVGCQHYWKKKIFLKRKNKEVSFYDALKIYGGLNKKEQRDVHFPVNPSEVTQVASADNNFWKLSIEDIGEIKMSSQERRLVVAPLLIPDLKIPRITKDGKVHLRFSREVIEKIQRDFRKKGYGNNATYEHKVKVDGVSVVEDWLIDFEEQDKSRGYGFKHKAGTWMVMLSIENDEIWNDYVKTGKVRGLSIEGRPIRK
jgi:hypothetical protein